MELLCELINNELTIYTNGKSIQLTIHSSFFTLDNDSPENLEFLKRVKEFLKETKKFSLTNFIFRNRNRIYVRTDLKNKSKIQDLYEFCKTNLKGHKPLIYDETYISLNDLKFKKFRGKIDLKSKINNEYIEKHRVSDIDIKLRRRVQLKGMFIITISSYLLTVIFPMMDNKVPQMQSPSIYWPFFFSIILFFGWIETSMMKISLKTAFNGFFGIIIPIILISRFSLKYVLDVLNLEYSFLWLELIIQGGFYFCWNEMIATNFNTTNDQLNK